MREKKRKVFEFGKIDYCNRGRKDCPVEVEICLYIDKNKNEEVFTASGSIWNGRHSDVYCCGQCLDEIHEFIKDKTFLEIYRLWKLYHLNDLHAGTPRQEKAIKEWKENNKYEYTKACEYLKSINLYEDNGYKYGHGWLYEPIPKEDLDKIYKLLGE